MVGGIVLNTGEGQNLKLNFEQKGASNLEVTYERVQMQHCLSVAYIMTKNSYDMRRVGI